LVPGAVLGTLMFTRYTLQTAGLERTTATNAGFITGLYIVFTPLLGLVLFKERVPRAAWIAVGLSVAGLALLSVTRFSDIHPRLGDLLVLAGALAWGGHLTALGRLSPGLPAVLLSLVQMGTAAGLHVLASAGGGLRTGEAMSVWPLLITTGVVGSGMAFTFQVVAQQEISPMRAAIILAGESLVAGAAAAIWLGERLSFHQWIGAGLIVGAMVLSELGARRTEAMRLEPGSAL
ncbi:MAG: DMT family transporter, partial [Actinomycetota bacterium]|nr:DMT family transporter [Actinomycetota bacterium]